MINFFILLIKTFLIGTIKMASYIGFSFITLLVPLLLIVAYLTLVERKVIGASQRRLGPNTTGFLV
jgi:NADH:ubiquinone oxidoreductase subunit H